MIGAIFEIWNLIQREWWCSVLELSKNVFSSLSFNQMMRKTTKSLHFYVFVNNVIDNFIRLNNSVLPNLNKIFKFFYEESFSFGILSLTEINIFMMRLSKFDFSVKFFHTIFVHFLSCWVFCSGVWFIYCFCLINLIFYIGITTLLFFFSFYN